MEKEWKEKFKLNNNFIRKFKNFFFKIIKFLEN